MKNSTRSIGLTVLAALSLLSASAQQRFGPEVELLKAPVPVPDAAYQRALRQSSAWSVFAAAHPKWSVEFDEASGKPHRAFGPPIATVGATPEERALNFIAAELGRFGVPAAELVHSTTAPTPKVTYVHFAQEHAGVPVVTGRLLVKLDALGRVIGFSTAVHEPITLDMQPAVSGAQAVALAAADLVHVTDSEWQDLRILPVPEARSVKYRLVHQVQVNTLFGDTPGKFQCWVDAHSGELVYRKNLVVNHEHGHDDGGDDAAEAQVNATVYDLSPLQPTVVEGLPELRLSVNGSFLFTDLEGYVPTGVTGPVDAQMQLRGRWSIVTTNNVMPSFTTSLAEGLNTVSFDANANIRERSAYRFVNKIHTHVKTWIPSFTSMDFALPTKVDLTTDNCNAFYDGSSINFYAEANGCRSLATVGDVVYHEYGHGINDFYYQSQSSAFINGGMNEGYADVWAFTLTQQPILAQGWQLDDVNSYIRRYDENPKVYPVDLVGQVHADGEIIAGAWWDLYRLSNWNMDLVRDLFVAAYPGLQANAFNGQEGQAFRDVLIDVLQADDDDADLTNGTPNGSVIIEAFAIHGITLLSNADLLHDGLTVADAVDPITIDATAIITFPFTTYLASVDLHYKVNNASAWTSVPMTDLGGSDYTAEIPGQPAGSVVAYYLSVQDVLGQESAVQPVGAAQADPNLPYYILVGCELRATEDGDNNSQLGLWTTGLPTDNAISGEWEQGVPIASYGTPGDASTIVQTGTQHTPGGELCFYTGNAASTSSPLGENDVDGGSTTLISSTFSVAAYEDPVVTYWRWYTNNPPSGANPNADWWQVYISNNSGTTWVPVEDTRTGERNWRRKAFRIQDVVTPTATMRLKFIASDSLRPGQNLDGGSLVEAAVDDI